jgi:hypothetical protein
MKRRSLIAGLALLVATTASVAATGSAGARSTAVTRCLKVPAPLTNLLRSSLAFSAGGQLFYVRAVKSPKVARLYFLSAQLRSAQLGKKRPIGTWAVDKLDATATAAPLNATAKAYSDLAAPDPGTVKVTMASAGALASQKCVAKLIR